MNHVKEISAIKILLVAYINRSGSTLLMNELSKVKNITCLPESELLAKKLLRNPTKKIKRTSKVVIELDKALHNNNKLKLFKGIGSFGELIVIEENSISQQELFRRFIIKAAIAENPDTEIVVFKNTHISYYIKNIQECFIQDANIYLLILLRDPRAIFLSQLKAVGSWKIPMASDAAAVIFEWRRLSNVYNYFQRKKQSWVSSLKYEKLVTDTVSQTNNLFVWLNINIEVNGKDNNGTYQNKIPKELQHLHQNIKLEIQTKSCNLWQFELDNEYQQRIAYMLRKPMIRLDYNTHLEKRTLHWWQTGAVTVSIKIAILYLKMKLFGPEIPQSNGE